MKGEELIAEVSSGTPSYLDSGAFQDVDHYEGRLLRSIDGTFFLVEVLVEHGSAHSPNSLTIQLFRQAGDSSEDAIRQVLREIAQSEDRGHTPFTTTNLIRVVGRLEQAAEAKVTDADPS